MSRVWFVTGSSTGLGRTMVERALSQGDRVVATLRTPSALDSLVSQYPATQLLVLGLDVTSPTSAIAAAFSTAVERFGRIDLVVSNAGIGGPIGESEALPDEKKDKAMDVNFWGVTKVAVEALKVFRDVNKPQGGVFVHVSSSLGVDSPALCGLYTASKHAAEAWLDSLSRELDPKWNVKVQIMNPGGFNTPFSSKNGDLLPQHPLYTSLAPDHPAVQLREAYKLMISGADIGLPKPDSFVDALLKVVEMKEKGEDIPFRVPVGHDSLGAFRSKTKALGDSVEKFAVISKDFKFMAPQE